jgi:hypothetical protein
MPARKGTSAIWQLDNSSLTSITNPVGGPGTPGAITLTGVVWNFQKIDGKRTAEKGILKNGAGAIKGVSYTGPTREATVTIIPSGATMTIAKQANVIPDAGAVLVLADSDDASVAGNWIVDEASWTRANDPQSSKAITFQVWNAADSDVSADASVA